MSDQQEDVSKGQAGRSDDAGEAADGKAGREVRDLTVAAVGTLAAVAALVTLAVQREYLILLITFFTCLGLMAIYYIIGYFRRVKDRRLVVAFVVLPIVTAVVGILLATMPTKTEPNLSVPTSSPNPRLVPTSTPSTLTPAPVATSPAVPGSNSVEVEIRPPAAIHAGKDAELDGTVTGLGQASLWIIEQPSDSLNTLVISGDGPVATSDGHWTLSATEIGDSSDIGHKMGFVAIRADKDCSERLSKVVRDAGEKAAQIDPGLYPGCTKVGTRVDIPVIE